MTLVKTKKWGNSIGIIIPKDVVRGLNITEKEEIDVNFSKKSENILRELWDSGKKGLLRASHRSLHKIRENESKLI